MRLLVWQWGRRGGGPRYAMDLLSGLRGLADIEVCLSLSQQSEIMRGADPPRNDLPMRTYDGGLGLLARLPGLPFEVGRLARQIRAMRPDAAICAMPAVLDLVMVAALRRAGVPYAVVVHDADLHPGERYRVQMVLQRRLVARAGAVVALSRHVAARLRAQGTLAGKALIVSEMPPIAFGPPPPPPRSHGGKLRLLCFGRLLPYKGLDLLASAMAELAPGGEIELLVVGSGPESAELDRLRALPGVRVENRWVPEGEVGSIMAWADAVVLPYREASQSGVAAAALAARRWVVATRVGGIAEQLEGVPTARLCEPDAASLATALRGLVTSGAPGWTGIDPATGWRAAAAELVRELRVAWAL